MKIKQPLKNRLLAMLLSLCIVCGTLPAMFLSASALEVTSGTGSAENPVPIRTAEELVQIGQLINSSSIWNILKVPENSIIHYRLEADISLSDHVFDTGWTPIGNERRPFTGVFNGNGHTITGLSFSVDTGEEVNALESPGLFGVIGGGGKVTGLTVDVSSVSKGRGQVFVGGIAGQLLKGGVIENCFVSGQMDNQTSGGDGGIVGYLDGGAVKNCIVTASLSSSGSSAGVVGNARSGDVSGCVILSKQLNGAAVTWEKGSISISDCYAWDGIDRLINSTQAAKLTYEQLRAAANWPEAFKTAPWQYEDGKMPTLAGEVRELPTYILGGLGGKGTPSEPYLINDIDGLALFFKMGRRLL